MNTTTHSVPTQPRCLPMNTSIPLPPHEHDAFRCPPHEHDDDVVSPFRPSHVHEPSPYVSASRRSRPRPYVHIRGRIIFLAPWPLYICVHATCAPLLRHVRASTTTRACLYIDQYICTYTFATRMTMLRTLQPGGSRLSGTSLPAKM